MIARICFALLGLLLPIFLWVCYKMGWPLWLGGILLLPLVFRKSALFGSAVGLVAAIMGVATLVLRSERALLYYPVLMSSVFLLLFTFSVWRPPTIAERIARLMMPNLPPRGVLYTRRVTIAWCVFFLVNGLIALWTTTQSMNIWMLYNGLLSYVAMGVMFALEWLIRRRMMHRYRDEIE